MNVSLDIRAAVLHVEETAQTPETIEKKIASFLEGLDRFTQSIGLKVISKRIVAPPVFLHKLPDVLDLLLNMAEAHHINYLGIPLLNVEAKSIAESLETYPKLYLSVEYNPKEMPEYIKTLRLITESSPLQATKFAVSFGPQPQTPYFPVTQSVKEGVTLSLLYTQMFENYTSQQIHKTIGEIQGVASLSWSNFLGIDFSLSPWMDNSVARIIEKRSGVMLTLPGTVAAIRELNREIEELAKVFKSTGFNEVMLPIAEDNRLKELVKNGTLKLSHLINYSTYCVAGLDMAVIPDTTEDNILAGILNDLWHIYLLKRKTIGMRLILAPEEEGGEIDLGIFGKTPVISPLS
ncbi:MAG: DUF711 family protein [Infirmifilum sp.]